MEALHWWRQSDAVTQTAALLLLVMSVASWVLILWKARLLGRVRRDLARSLAAFWQAPGWQDAHATVAAFDRERLVLPLVEAAQATQATPAPGVSRMPAPAQATATRLLRGALLAGVGRLQYGHTVLATVGATAPFVGLLGTVWGIYHAMSAMAGAGQISVERLAGPVGEALIMTAAGLAVAIPAVLAYNVLGRQAALVEAELEGFAHDLRELCTPPGPG